MLWEAETWGAGSTFATVRGRVRGLGLDLGGDGGIECNPATRLDCREPAGSLQSTGETFSLLIAISVDSSSRFRFKTVASEGCCESTADGSRVSSSSLLTDSASPRLGFLVDVLVGSLPRLRFKAVPWVGCFLAVDSVSAARASVVAVLLGFVVLRIVAMAERMLKLVNQLRDCLRGLQGMGVENVSWRETNGVKKGLVANNALLVTRWDKASGKFVNASPTTFTGNTQPHFTS
jgi:hypothetical protein